MLSTMDPVATAANHVENGGLEDELRATKRKISLSNCGVCGSEEAKYRCPACLKHSCSLTCVKKHKEEAGCSGVRNKTAYVALNHFDEMNLLSDYRFLEDTGRMADSATRDPVVRTPRFNFRAKNLAAGARKMNITLRFLPIGFTKSRENSTVYNNKENRFLWHLKLLFPQSSYDFSERRVPHEKTLEQILKPYIHPTESDPVRRQRLKMYVHDPFDQVKVFMKAEGRKANSIRYHELDLGKSLRDNISYKTLIEYPVLHVVLKGHYHDYPLKGSAEPTSACNNLATEQTWLGSDRGKEGVTYIPPPQPGSHIQGGTNALGGTQAKCPETEPPKKKRAKSGPEEEVEEGEIADSSDDEEEEEEEEGNAEDGVVNKDEDDDDVGPAADDERADSMVVDVAGNVEHDDRGPCVTDHANDSGGDDGTVGESESKSSPTESVVHIEQGVNDENELTHTQESCA